MIKNGEPYCIEFMQQNTGVVLFSSKYNRHMLSSAAPTSILQSILNRGTLTNFCIELESNEYFQFLFSYFLALAAVSQAGRAERVKEVNNMLAHGQTQGLCVRMVKSREAATIRAYEILLPWKSQAILEC